MGPEAAGDGAAPGRRAGEAGQARAHGPPAAGQADDPRGQVAVHPQVCAHIEEHLDLRPMAKCITWWRVHYCLDVDSLLGLHLAIFATMQRAPELKHELSSRIHSFFVMSMLQEHWKQGSDPLV